MTKKIHLSADQIKPLVTGLGTCFATEKITVQGLPVRFMYREAPIASADSGWRFLSGLESDAYMENANNQGAFDVNLIANCDPSIIPFLESPVGAAFEKTEEGGAFKEASLGARRRRGLMTPSPLIWPMASHVGLTAFLYVLLTAARAPAIWGLGHRADGTNPWSGVEPRISANLSNQFEWPLFFYVACLLCMRQPVTEGPQLWMASIFAAGRFAHSHVQIMTTNVRLRGAVFTVNFLAVIGMWGLLLRGLKIH